jgi:hypothetical protein
MENKIIYKVWCNMDNGEILFGLWLQLICAYSAKEITDILEKIFEI